MFFLVRNLKTNLVFSPHDMDRLHSEKAIIQMLREKMQGLCFNQTGYIIKVARDEGQYSSENYVENMKEEEGDEQEEASSGRRGFLISTPEVDEYGGIKVSVTFSAVCFKAQKFDLIEFKVTAVSEASIKGYIGPVEVVIPVIKTEDFDYKKDENILISRAGGEGKIVKIDKGTKLKARCIESKIQLGVNMIIIAELPKSLISFIENDYK